MISIFWLVSFVILIGIEVATMALTTIWFAGGALAAFFLSLVGAGIEFQLAAFVAISFLLLFLTRPFAQKYINGSTVKTNAEGLIGRKARVTSEINNELGVGSAMVDGQEWTARALDADKTYPVGAMVTIHEIQGVKLIVKAS